MTPPRSSPDDLSPIARSATPLPHQGLSLPPGSAMQRERVAFMMRGIESGDAALGIALLPLVDPRAPDANQHTLLMRACEFDRLEWIKILAPRSDLDAVDDYGTTALMRSVAREHEAGVVELLRAGANPNLQDGHGKTALMDACHHDSEPIVKALLQASDLSLRDKHGFDALIHAAIFADSLRIVGLAAEACELSATDSEHGLTAAQWADREKRPETATFLRALEDKAALQDTARHAPQATKRLSL